MNDTNKFYGFVYITTNTVNGKMYIGKRVIDKRGVWKTYLGSGVLLRKAIKKYGKENLSRKLTIPPAKAGGIVKSLLTKAREMLRKGLVLGIG